MILSLPLAKHSLMSYVRDVNHVIVYHYFLGTFMRRQLFRCCVRFLVVAKKFERRNCHFNFSPDVSGRRLRPIGFGHRRLMLHS